MMEKKQLTVRLPQTIFEYLSSKAEHEQKSVNDIMIDITEQYMKLNEGEKVLREILVLRENAKQATGVHPDSTDEIRRMREGER